MGVISDIANKVTDDYELARKKMMIDGEKAMKDVFKELFVQLPDLKSVSWKQYAPSFNDGDACVFSVHDPRFEVSLLEDVDEDEYNDFVSDYDGYNPYEKPSDYYPYFVKQGYEKQLEKLGTDELLRRSGIIDDFICAFQSFPDALFEKMFGGGSEVRVTKDGIEVSDYYD